MNISPATFIASYTQRLFTLQGETAVRELALEAFRYQAEANPVYRSFLHHLRRNPSDVKAMEDIPFLPISFFKYHKVCSGHDSAPLVFSSSGTTGTQTSRHYVTDPLLYDQSFLHAFRLFFGEPSEFCFIALLPSYLERQDSSLVYMVHRLIQESRYPQSGFYKDVDKALYRQIRYCEDHGIPTIIWGVTFALLDLAEQYPMPLRHCRILETGGMKGRRREITRSELHNLLCHAFDQQQILSEYGMTELLSQAYLLQGEEFSAPPWMQILIRDTNDPLELVPDGRTGGINVIDLANIHSCCFIATQDLGKKTSPNRFTVLGRFDNSDIRGCNLLLE